MSTWSAFDTTLTHSPDLSTIETDGTDIYWLDGSSNLIHYDISTNTETIIYTLGTSPIDFIWEFCVFGGNVYAVGSDASGSVDVYIYNGTPDDWSSVDTLRANRTAGTYAQIFCNDDWMVALHVDYNTTYTTVSHYTNDGSSWAAAGFATTPIMAQSNLPGVLACLKQYGSRPAITAFCVSNAGGPGYACTGQALMKFGGTAWTNVDNPIVDANRVVGPESDTCWTWDVQGADLTCSELSNDDFSTQSVPDSAVCVIPTINMPESIAYDNNGNDLVLYKWSGLSWSSWDTGVNINIDPATPDARLLRTSDNNVYLVIFNTYTSTYEIWKRADAYVVTAGAAQFYFGNNELLKTADLTITGTLPGAMAVNPQSYDVVVGNNTVDTVMAEKLVDSNGYATPTDFTDGISATDDSIKKLEYI